MSVPPDVTVPLSPSVITMVGGTTDCTAASALTMPAPHSEVVQLHSASLVATGVVPVGVTHAGTPVGCGNGVAVAFKRARMVSGVKLGFAPSINAIVPDTIGAEKLVPKFVLV